MSDPFNYTIRDFRFVFSQHNIASIGTAGTVLPTCNIAILFVALYNNNITVLIDRMLMAAQLVRRRTRRPCEKLTGTIRNAIPRGGGAGVIVIIIIIYRRVATKQRAYFSPSLLRTWAAAAAAPVARTRMLSLRTRETGGGAKPVSDDNKF